SPLSLKTDSYYSEINLCAENLLFIHQKEDTRHKRLLRTSFNQNHNEGVGHLAPTNKKLVITSKVKKSIKNTRSL
ncbi:hypothetical protein, partial [Bacillus subtilis]|uniref:hypothetical protein n=1 Tax=Bacillus subtilis TaxID=1423 RepID=UPI002282AD1B